eukprot:3147261-Pleurochrysis_carterae.AAC.4
MDVLRRRRGEEVLWRGGRASTWEVDEHEVELLRLQSLQTAAKCGHEHGHARTRRDSWTLTIAQGRARRTRAAGEPHTATMSARTGANNEHGRGAPSPDRREGGVKPHIVEPDLGAYGHIASLDDALRLGEIERVALRTRAMHASGTILARLHTRNDVREAIVRIQVASLARTAVRMLCCLRRACASRQPRGTCTPKLGLGRPTPPAQLRTAYCRELEGGSDALTAFGLARTLLCYHEW